MINSTLTSNSTHSNAYPDTSVDLWDKNIVNGEYIIAYELNYGLDRKIQDMLPKVSFGNAFSLSPRARVWWINLGHGKNWECHMHQVWGKKL